MIIAVGGVYDPRIHLNEVVMPVLRKWRIFEREDFTGEASVMEPEKLPEFGWFPLDALPSPLSRFAADAVKALGARHFARRAAS